MISRADSELGANWRGRIQLAAAISLENLR